MLALFGRPLTTGQRRFLLFVTHLGLAALSNWLAFVLRFDEDIPAEQWNLLVTWLPWLLVIRALAFYRFRLYDGLWRYTSLWDIRNLVLGIAASTAVFAGWSGSGWASRPIRHRCSWSTRWCSSACKPVCAWRLA